MKKTNQNFNKKAMHYFCVAFLVISLTTSLLARGESQSTWERKLKAHSVGMGLGQVFLYGDHGDYGNSAMGVDFFYAYTVSYSFDLLVNTHFSSHSKGVNKTSLWGSNVNIKGRLMDFDSFSPYILGGLGFYAPKNKRMVSGTLQDSSRKLGFGLSFGAGVDLRLNDKITIGIMTAFHRPFDIAQDNGPDVSGSYLRVLLNLFYTF